MKTARHGKAQIARWLKGLAAIAATAGLTACGGGGGSGAGSGGGTAAPNSVAVPAVVDSAASAVAVPVAPAAPIVTDSGPEKPGTRFEAARFLTQATFGPTEGDIDRVMAIGYGAWIDEQFAKPQPLHRTAWEAADAAAKALSASASAGQDGVLNSFWKQALRGDDALRQRVAFALSQIYVVSLADDGVGSAPRGAADYLDMLGREGLGRHRDLLQAVALHPMMGLYLSAMHNQKADTRTGRVPDENFAREVMQLFTIGLYELNADGSARGSAGQPVDTYAAADIAGLAKVFTGWSWACPDWPNDSCFYGGSLNGNADPDRTVKAMLAYPKFHSTEEKKFLGKTVAAQSTADPAASLKAALDALHNHANAGPFLARQLIQRLVTSNPSPAYVAAVAAVFADNGSGVRGDMKAVVKAVLMHPQARSVSATAGKLREPVLRLSALLRAFPFNSDSGEFKVGNTDNPATQLGQTPLRAPAVFNFYRPGYVPPGTQAAAAGLVVPEMQLANESSGAGYVNYMRDAVSQGVGAWNSALSRRDLQPDFSAELALAAQPAALVERINGKLMYGTMPAALKSEVQGAVEKIVLPTLNSTASNQKQLDDAKRNRVNAALLLTLASPEFQVQK